MSELGEIKQTDGVANANDSSAPIVHSNIEIRNLTCTVQGWQVAPNSALAMPRANRNPKPGRKEEREAFSRNLSLPTQGEFDPLTSQSVTPNGRGGRRKLPYALTDQGVSMPSTALRSGTAIDISVAIVKVFARMRRQRRMRGAPSWRPAPRYRSGQG